MATPIMTYCPTCGQPLNYHLDHKNTPIGTCKHCTVTLSADEWQRYADDPAFRERYAAAIAHAQVIAAQPLENTGIFAVLKLTRSGVTHYKTVEYQFEQEITCEIKFARLEGYVCELVADSLSAAQAELVVQS